MIVERESRGAINLVAGGMLAAAMLLYLRRYVGINHDAALYLAIALKDRWPVIFSKDLFFAHGSQGSYTLLPWLVSRLFDWASPATIFLTGSLISLLAFAGAGWFFLRSLLPPQQRYWALLGVLCLPSSYAVIRIFSYGEPFLTSRPLAEAFCLLGVGLLTRRRLLATGLCMLTAGLLHPLQALGACLVAWPWLIAQDRRWLHALWLSLPVAALAWVGVPPFSSLFQSFDPQWLAVVQEFTGQLFLTSWHVQDFNALAFDVVILALARKTLPQPMSGWCTAGLAGLALGLLATLILADGLHLVLPTALQLWRAHWLAHLLAMASIAALLYRDIQSSTLPRAFCLGLAVLLVQGPAWVWIPLALLYAFWPRLFGGQPSRIQQVIGVVCVLGMLALLAIYVANEWLPFRMAHYRLELYAIDRRLLAFPLLALGLPLLGITLWERSSVKLRMVLLLGALLPLTALGIDRWDWRPPMARLVESGHMTAALFGPEIPRQAQVFWPNDIYPTVWMGLHRAEYFSTRQIAGVVFNRATFPEARQHLDRILPIIQEDLFCQGQPQAQRERCQLDDDAMRNACQPGPTRRPDYMVLPYRQPQQSEGHWDFIDPATGKPAVSYWLYSCAQVMQDLDARPRTLSR